MDKNQVTTASLIANGALAAAKVLLIFVVWVATMISAIFLAIVLSGKE